MTEMEECWDTAMAAARTHIAQNIEKGDSVADALQSAFLTLAVYMRPESGASLGELRVFAEAQVAKKGVSISD